MQQERLQEDAKQRSKLHRHQRILHLRQCIAADCRRTRNNAGTARNHLLGHIKHRHHDIEGVRDQHDRHKGLEDSLEENPCLKIGKIVVNDNQLNQLVTGNEGQDHPRDGDDHRL